LTNIGGQTLVTIYGEMFFFTACAVNWRLRFDCVTMDVFEIPECM